MHYNVRKQTIIVGGHDTWLKAIMRMLSGNVRFIGREQVGFDKALFRKTETIWIQPNSVSHKIYYRIINGARAQGIKVFYFSNASALKCAIQVEEKDKQGDRNGIR